MSWLKNAVNKVGEKAEVREGLQSSEVSKLKWNEKLEASETEFRVGKSHLSHVNMSDRWNILSLMSLA